MSIKVEKMDKIDPGNPFNTDQYRMGTDLGNNVTAMFQNFAKDRADYVIVINTVTGERVKIHFGDDVDDEIHIPKQFRLHWKDGRTEIVKGDDIADAFSKAGYGRGALTAMDWYEPM